MSLHCHNTKWQTDNNIPHIAAVAAGETVLGTTAALAEMTTETAPADSDHAPPETGQSAQIVVSETTMLTANDAMSR